MSLLKQLIVYRHQQLGAKMNRGLDRLFHYLIILLLLSVIESKKVMKTDVLLSPKIELEAGEVSNKYYYGIDFPKGHIAIKSFNGEVVDENGNPVPLHQTYLHHWIVVRYYQRRGGNVESTTDFNVVKNSGLCENGLVQYFGLGSETRRTATDVPDPYGIEVGNPADVPDGFDEKWMLNVHAIDTRGALDKLGCTECRCDLYNASVDGYNGGLRCCHDKWRCRLKEGFEGGKRSLYLRYTVNYVRWEASIIPVSIYILDVTDIWTRADESRGLKTRHICLIEYEVEPCGVGKDSDSCGHAKTLSVSLPSGGDVIYGVGHQHAGGTGLTLYGEGGRVICKSVPTYGSGDEVGNEAGYIVGMSTCYPQPGSIKISAGETLTLVSNYSSAQRHTGVMGLFYLLLSNAPLHSPTHVPPMSVVVSNYGWAIALLGVGILFALMFVFNFKREREEGYEPIITP